MPWGAGSILALLVAWFVTQFLVLGVHYELTGRSGTAEAAAALVEQAAGDEDADAHPDADGKEEAEAPPPWTHLDQLTITALVFVLLLPQFPMILMLTSGATPRDMGLTTPNLPINLVRGFVACLLLAPICYALNLLMSQVWAPQEHVLITTVREEFTGGVALLAIFSAVLLAPAFEELAFRGVLLPWFEAFFARVRRPSGQSQANIEPETAVVPDTELSSDYGAIPCPVGPLDSTDDFEELPRLTGEPPTFSGEASATPVGFRDGPSWENRSRTLANVVTSLIFASLHLAQWPAPIPLFVLSMGLGVLIQRTGSLWPSIVLHATFNALSTAALFAALSLGGDHPAEKAVPAPAAGPARSRRPRRRWIARFHILFRECPLAVPKGRDMLSFPPP